MMALSANQKATPRSSGSFKTGQESTGTLEDDTLADVENEDEYNIKITKYDNSFTCNLNEDKCSQSKCLCDSFLIDQLIEELKTGFQTGRTL